MKISSAVIALSALSGFVSAAPCSNNANFPTSLQGASIPLTQIAVATDIGLELKGTIKIVDKCNFQIVGMTLKAGGPLLPNFRIRFYGLPTDSSKDPFPLTDAYFDREYDNEDSPVFPLSQRPGTLQDGISFKDFKEFRAFSETRQLLFGQANFEQIVANTGYGTSDNTNTNTNNIDTEVPKNNSAGSLMVNGFFMGAVALALTMFA